MIFYEYDFSEYKIIDNNKIKIITDKDKIKVKLIKDGHI
jgi:hypothetical protein